MSKRLPDCPYRDDLGDPRPPSRCMALEYTEALGIDSTVYPRNIEFYGPGCTCELHLVCGTCPEGWR